MKICMNCGNFEYFQKHEYFKLEGYRIRYYSGHDNALDVQDSDPDEIEDEHVYEEGELTCCNCEEIGFIKQEDSETQLRKIQWEHTKKNGDWSFDKLPEEERDVKLEAAMIEQAL